jgi:hypothetical protein
MFERSVADATCCSIRERRMKRREAGFCRALLKKVREK